MLRCYKKRKTTREFYETVLPFLLPELHAESVQQREIKSATNNTAESYGFQINKTNTKWENTKNVLLLMPGKTYENKQKQSKHHNLHPDHLESDLDNPSNKSPNAGKLLSLGLKFCVQLPKPSNNIPTEKSIVRFKRDIHIKFNFTGKIQDELYDKKIYIKST